MSAYETLHENGPIFNPFLLAGLACFAVALVIFVVGACKKNRGEILEIGVAGCCVSFLLAAFGAFAFPLFNHPPTDEVVKAVDHEVSERYDVSDVVPVDNDGKLGDSNLRTVYDRDDWASDLRSGDGERPLVGVTTSTGHQLVFGIGFDADRRVTLYKATTYSGAADSVDPHDLPQH